MPVRVVPRSLTEAYKKREGDFAPNLVGFQATSAPLFTLGNFAITTNLEGKFDKSFDLGGEWSDYYSLDSLSLTEEDSKLLESNQFFIDLNFDISKIDRYAHFGSLTEFVRVNIEQIILGWKGSLYMNKNLEEPALNTVLTYAYDDTTDTSTFRIPVSSIINDFNLTYEDNETFSTEVGDISNLKNDYTKYFLWNEFGSFIITDYDGSTDADPYINIETFGEVWPSLTATTFGSFNYHIRPLPDETNKFFIGLKDFQKVMLNTLITPKYTLELEIPYENEDGNVINENRKFSWPTTDGYNLDINGYKYTNYIDNLFEATQQYDRLNSDLISRKYVSASIHEFDTPGEGTNDTGEKVQKLLRIYGREFDDIKKYVDGISFANIVTYNKRDNTSDDLIKMMAKTLGLDVLETIFGNDFNLLDYSSAGESPQFEGFSREYTPKEIEVEFWRRLVINAWWLWKSKGARKVLEFFLKLFRISDTLIDLNEHIYLVGKRLDTQDVLQQIEDYFEQVGDPSEVVLSDYPMDVYGFPKALPNTEDYWFHMEGGWYNGGTEITQGNNPHFGPYDYGSSYINKFSNFIDNQITSVTGDTTTTIENLFTDYGNLVENVDTFTVSNGDTQVSDAQGARKYVFSTESCDPCQGVTVGEITVSTPETPFTADDVTLTFNIVTSGSGTFAYTWDVSNSGPTIVSGQGTDTITITITNTTTPFTLSVAVSHNNGGEAWCNITQFSSRFDYSDSFVEPFSCTATPTPEDGSGNGSIYVTFTSGTPPYHITLDGPVQASLSGDGDGNDGWGYVNSPGTNGSSYTVNNLIEGDYIVATVDSTGSESLCLHYITVGTTELNIEDVQLYRVGGASQTSSAYWRTKEQRHLWVPYYLVGNTVTPLTNAQAAQFYNQIHGVGGTPKITPSWFVGNGVNRSAESGDWGSKFSAGEVRSEFGATPKYANTGSISNSCFDCTSGCYGSVNSESTSTLSDAVIKFVAADIAQSGEPLDNNIDCTLGSGAAGVGCDCFSFRKSRCFYQDTPKTYSIDPTSVVHNLRNPSKTSLFTGGPQSITTNIFLEEWELTTDIWKYGSDMGSYGGGGEYGVPVLVGTSNVGTG